MINHTEGGFYKNFCECWSYLDTNPLKQNNILVNGLIFFDHEVSWETCRRNVFQIRSLTNDIKRKAIVNF